MLEFRDARMWLAILTAIPVKANVRLKVRLLPKALC